MIFYYFEYIIASAFYSRIHISCFYIEANTNIREGCTDRFSNGIEDSIDY